MSLLLYTLDELRCHLALFREPVTIAWALAAALGPGEELGRRPRSVMGSTAGLRTTEA